MTKYIYGRFSRTMPPTVGKKRKYGFFKNYKPVLNDVPYRSFEKMEDYRKWADENLPRYLGYKIVKKEN